MFTNEKGIIKRIELEIDKDYLTKLDEPIDLSPKWLKGEVTVLTEQLDLGIVSKIDYNLLLGLIPLAKSAKFNISIPNYHYDESSLKMIEAGMKMMINKPLEFNVSRKADTTKLVVEIFIDVLEDADLSSIDKNDYVFKDKNTFEVIYKIVNTQGLINIDINDVYTLRSYKNTPLEILEYNLPSETLISVDKINKVSNKYLLNTEIGKDFAVHIESDKDLDLDDVNNIIADVKTYNNDEANIIYCSSINKDIKDVNVTVIF